MAAIASQRKPCTIIALLMLFLYVSATWFLTAAESSGQSPAPVLDSVFPPGAAVGQKINIAIAGEHLTGLQTLRCSAGGVRFTGVGSSQIQVSVPADVMPGHYDVWAVSAHGVSLPRPFIIGNRSEVLESMDSPESTSVQRVAMNSVVNGRIGKAGETDRFQFEARKGKRIVIECQAERIDSRLRAVLELKDSSGRLITANRGYFGIDPLIDFTVPADGTFSVSVHDLTFAGGQGYYYRLEIDNGPRVAFAIPSVVRRGMAARVQLHGWNLPGSKTADSRFDQVDLDIPVGMAVESWPLPVRLGPAQTNLRAWSYHLPGSHAPVALGITDCPVVLDKPDNHMPVSAQKIHVPCEVSGQLAAGDERDWFSFNAYRGEVLHFEAMGQRIQAPVDLDLKLFDGSGDRQLAHFADSNHQLNTGNLSASHLDPVGRWVVPADGSYLISIRNLSGGLGNDPRRIYRLSVRREEYDFQVLAVPRREDAVGLALHRGGALAFDIIAFRQRGMTDPIRVAARGLPLGISCPDAWIGPGEQRTTIVLASDEASVDGTFDFRLEATSSSVGQREVRYGTMVRPGYPIGWWRIMAGMPLSVSGNSPLKITVDAYETITHQLYGKLRPRHCPGSVVDLAVAVERRDKAIDAPVKLGIVGLPESVQYRGAIIPAGQNKGYISIYLPPTLATGPYSVAVHAETTAPGGKTVQTYSHAIGLEVQPAAFVVDIDPLAPTRVKRGETVKVGYSARRRNGFIGKIHTELASPGHVTDVMGLRGRGETFVGQTETGSLQIEINKDAPLGNQAFLRLFSVGVVEDEPIHHGATFLPLEIVE